MNKETVITILITVICLFIVIYFKGVTVTDESKGIINKHMTWIEFIKLTKE